MKKDLIHNVAVSMARALVDRLIIPEDQKPVALDEFYAVCVAGMEVFDQEMNQQLRVAPSDN